jgi:hypothetical protein
MASRRVPIDPALLMLSLTAGLVSANPQAAAAVSPTVELFSAFSLLGTWSPNCKLPPSLTNPRVAWRIEGDTILHSVTFDGRTFAVVDRVGAASLIDADTLTFSVIRAERIYAMVNVRMENGRLQLIRSVRYDGHVIVDQGREVSTGRDVPADEPCSPPIS